MVCSCTDCIVVSLTRQATAMMCNCTAMVPASAVISATGLMAGMFNRAVPPGGHCTVKGGLHRSCKLQAVFNWKYCKAATGCMPVAAPLFTPSHCCSALFRRTSVAGLWQMVLWASWPALKICPVCWLFQKYRRLLWWRWFGLPALACSTCNNHPGAHKR